LALIELAGALSMPAVVGAPNVVPIDVRTIPPLIEGTFVGRVVTLQGRPFPGSTVSWLTVDPENGHWCRAAARTDSTGAFRFDAPPMGLNEGSVSEIVAEARIGDWASAP
jgi:hypothetical protein